MSTEEVNNLVSLVADTALVSLVADTAFSITSGIIIDRANLNSVINSLFNAKY